MLLLLLVIIQSLATIFLGVVLRHASRALEIPITIHNLPIILMNVLGLAVTLWLSVMFTHTYLMIGAFCCIIMLATADYSKGKIVSVLVSATAILIWAQLAIFVAFCLVNQEKLKI